MSAPKSELFRVVSTSGSLAGIQSHSRGLTGAIFAFSTVYYIFYLGYKERLRFQTFSRTHMSTRLIGDSVSISRQQVEAGAYVVC